MLYHGSKNLILRTDTIKPSVSYELKPYVYATSDMAYALIRSGNYDITKPLVREEHYEDGTHSLCELMPGAFEELFDRPGYIYIILDEDQFSHLQGSEFVSEKEVVHFARMKIENVLRTIKLTDSIKLIEDEDSSEYWKNVHGGKEGFIQRRYEAINQIKSV